MNIKFILSLLITSSLCASTGMKLTKSPSSSFMKKMSKRSKVLVTTARKRSIYEIHYEKTSKGRTDSNKTASTSSTRSTMSTTSSKVNSLDMTPIKKVKIKPTHPRNKKGDKKSIKITESAKEAKPEFSTKSLVNNEAMLRREQGLTNYYKLLTDQTAGEINAALHNPYNSLQKKLAIAVYTGRYDYLEALIHNQLKEYPNSKKAVESFIKTNLNNITQESPIHVSIRMNAHHKKTMIDTKKYNNDQFKIGQYNRKYNDSLKTLHLLIEQLADINAVNAKGQTPLHVACSKKEYEVVNILLNAKANPHIFDSNGKLPTDVLIDLVNGKSMSPKEHIKYTKLFEEAQRKFDRNNNKKHFLSNLFSLFKSSSPKIHPI